MDILITNNPLVRSEITKYRTEYIDTDLMGVLIRVRDLIHKGHRLLTHPLSGSLKPNETPYKTVLLSGQTGDTDAQSVTIIEESILTVKKFPNKEILTRHLKDLQLVDLTLIECGE